MSKPISQREARAFRKRVHDLESVLDRQGNAWADSWPGGVNITTIASSDAAVAAIRTARLLKHACVVTIKSDGNIAVYALPIANV